MRQARPASDVERDATGCTSAAWHIAGAALIVVTAWAFVFALIVTAP